MKIVKKLWIYKNYAFIQIIKYCTWHRKFELSYLWCKIYDMLYVTKKIWHIMYMTQKKQNCYLKHSRSFVVCLYCFCDIFWNVPLLSLLLSFYFSVYFVLSFVCFIFLNIFYLLFYLLFYILCKNVFFIILC